MIGFIALGVVVYQLRSPAGDRRSSSKPVPPTGTPSTSCGSSSSHCCTP
ncbi:cytochrome c oxidase, subunit III domain protein [Mycobacterium xenopi 4042]|uniref:Cytochrome c oxidase, subunit III domain protein n=1 Tax=Mycobacterium xenopi 4042 TaxID=1299334 RepID=X8AH51_MYCXE|nr:cytochrome c oxidase, subunit III domain protein [Mycobacterium xenopi 4042]